MQHVSISIPDAAAAVFGRSEEAGESILAAAVVKWCELGRISHGKAAEILEISRAEFLDLLASYRVSAWQYSEAEITEELSLE